MTSDVCWIFIGGEMYLRCFGRTKFLIGGSGRPSLFHLLFRLVCFASLGNGTRVVRERDWFVVLWMVSGRAILWSELVCVVWSRCFWSHVFCVFLCKVVWFLRF
jgi:hypothetical protein